MFDNPQQFHNDMRVVITEIAGATDQLIARSRSFEIRGGKLQMNTDYNAGQPDGSPTVTLYGDETEEMVIFHNALVAFLAQNNNQYRNMLDRLRNDI